MSAPVNGWTIWKWPLAIADRQTLMLPHGARVLAVQVQDGSPCLWALVDPAAGLRPRVFATFGTGHKVQDGQVEHIGTFQLQGGALAFHVFEVPA